MKKQHKNYQTQWTGQFGTAYELTRRGHLVTFTTGNAPQIDLLCQSPGGVLFSVQVKSLSSKTYFLYQEALLQPNPNLFLVFVLVPAFQPELPQAPEYFVLNHKQFLQVVDEQTRVGKAAEKRRGKPYAAFAPGINYPVLAGFNFRDAWGILPQ
jgi:hypothetical protein